MEIVKKEYQVTGGPSSCGLKEIKMRLYESKQPIELKKAVFIIPGFDYSEFKVEDMQEKRNKGCTILYGKMKHSKSSDEVIMEYRPEEETGSLKLLEIPNFLAKYFT